ncbi:disease resistance protein RPS5-like [Quercus lobata]|uniref:disease resistance protein RPS5-like n=1 Tax=Quercus lobata TaxID=97700 RepID=UPI001243B159|nr:disease resistance protein RPS5-like [Quercus lobata]
MHVGEPIEPSTSLTFLSSGTSKGATEEPFLSKSSKLVELPEPETTPISLEKQELLSAHGTDVMEKKGKMSILETEIEIVPSQPIEEGTSKQAAVEPMSVTVLPSGKDEIEIGPTGSQLLLEVSTYSNRSIERTSLEIFEYMNDVTARRIGFHGSDEIGRTSVLKALISNPKIKDLFDVVIWVTVSRNWSTRKVQDEVLRQLPLSPEDFNTDFEIAGKLLQVLRSQRFLLILDDVWEPIDLNAAGIPDPALKKGCKMIFSTRFQNVCHVMGADREVQMEGLLPEEAWKLFQKLVGEIIDSPNIQNFARAIVQKCHGLPLLIIVTGRALAKENDALAWMHASKEFSLCSTHGIYGYEALIQKLKLSYDRLEGPDMKSCFLYCALFPEDQEISIDELVDYWIQEGLVARNRPDSHKRGSDIVDFLLGASLLQSVQVGLSIKMHNLIRDLASRILSLEVEGHQFLCGSYSKK